MVGPDTKNIEVPPAPIPGDQAPAPEPDTTKNVDALLSSLNTSAERFQTLWFSFLGLTLYFAIAAITTSHKDLLLGEPKTLPLLNIPVLLLPFFFIAPLLYLVFHFYLLMMLVLLCRTAAPFEGQLRATLPAEADRECYRARVENALFLQLLVGMKDERTGVNALLMGLIALITIVFAPLATLILIQLMFLPYHNLWMTWLHRAIVAAAVVLIIFLWNSCFNYSAVAPLLPFRTRPKLRLAAVRFVLIAFVFWLSAWEGRWAGEPGIGRANVADDFGSYPATRRGVIFGLLFPDRLMLPHETLVGKDKLEKTNEEIGSGGFSFVYTINLTYRHLEAADLDGADLRGAGLRGATLQDANLKSSRLDGVYLYRSQLQGTSLRDAHLQGAILAGAQWQDADLANADLRGATLADAQITKYPGAQLQGANLSGAQLQGSNLSHAEMQGANLTGAQLQGADLTGAQLQGADLSLAQLQDAKFRSVSVWRTNFADTDLSVASWGSVQIEPPAQSQIDGWIAGATEFARDSKAEVIQRFARLKLDFQPPAMTPRIRRNGSACKMRMTRVILRGPITVSDW